MISQTYATMEVRRFFLIAFMMACRISESTSALPASSSSSSSSSAVASGSGSASGSAEVFGANGCPLDWEPTGGQCLLFVWTPKTWSDALDICVDKGGTLFFPESADSMNFIRSLTTANGCTGFWLGCIDRSSPATGQFECPNQDGVYWNSAADFSGYWDWTSGYPAPSTRGFGDYCTLTLGMGQGGYWVETPCTYGDVCPVCSRKRQLPITTAPSPSMVSDPGSTIPLTSQSRHRSMIYQATASELGCLDKSYVIVILTVPTRIRCAAQCLAHRECVSFTFYKRKKKNCHLSSVSNWSVPDDGVTYNTSCTHYE